jgi:hypothetical protein
MNRLKKMSSNDELYFEQELKKYKKQILNTIKNRIVDIFKESIQESVYDVSESNGITWYERTEGFKNSVDIKWSGDDLLAYINTDMLNDYYSWINFNKTDNKVGQYLGEFLEEGHHGENGFGMYRDYEARHFLELAHYKIQNEFPGLEIRIIKDY